MFDDSDPSAISGRLAEATRMVDAAAAPIEGVFVALGDRLSAAVVLLRRLQGDFTGLSSSLESDRARQAEQGIRESVGRCAALAADAGTTSGKLGFVAESVDKSTKPMRALEGIFQEVGALAINAKIQAVEVRASLVDFSVFTTEMARLHSLAASALAQAQARVGDLGKAIAVAQRADDEFRRRDAGALENIKMRLERGIAAFSDRRQRSQSTMTAIGVRSGKIAQRVSDCIMQMQVNDLTRQRLEHVRDALKLVEETGLGDGRKRALGAAVCRLQGEQLRQAASDFAIEVGRMKTNLAALAGDAEQIIREAEGIFAGMERGRTFLSDLQADVDEVSRILDAHGAANAEVHDAVVGVMTGFDAVSSEIATIHSIDADMRVMGLNASLKCSRLGNRGRALGVVAQELRGCSRRTQEASEVLGNALAGAREGASGLAAWVNDSRSQASSLRGAILESMEALNTLGQDLHRSLYKLTGDCRGLSADLTSMSEDIRIHLDLDAGARAAMAALDLAAVQMSVGTQPYEGMDEDIRVMLAGQYTMARERAIHGMDDCEATAAAAAEDDCDVFFL